MVRSGPAALFARNGRLTFFSVLVALCLLLTVFMYPLINAVPTETTSVEEESSNYFPSYVFQVAGSTYFVTNEVTRETISGTNISRLVNNAIKNSEGIIAFHSGTYVFDNSIQMGNKTIIQGEGSATILQLADGANCDLITLATENVELTHIRDLHLDGNKLMNSQGSGIVYNNSETKRYSYIDAMHKISDVLITNFAEDGITISGQGTREVQMINTYVYESNQNGFHLNGGDHKLTQCVAGNNGYVGFSINGYGAFQLSNCKAFGNGQNSTYPNRDGFFVGENPRYVMFTGCSAQDNMRFGFTFYNTSFYGKNTGHQLVGCQADSNGAGATIGAGVRIDSNSTWISITGGMFIDRQTAKKNQDYGIWISGPDTDYIQIQGVTCTSNAKAGIYKQTDSTHLEIHNSWNSTSYIS